MADILKMGLKLLLITAVSALSLGVTHLVTEGPIAMQLERANTEARMAVLPQAEAFEPVLFDPETFPAVLEIYAGLDGDGTVGYAVKARSRGYGGEMEVIAGIRQDGIIEAVRVSRHRETPGLGAKAAEPVFRNQYAGLPADGRLGDGDVAAVTGATITSRAVTQAVNDAAASLRDLELIGGID